MEVGATSIGVTSLGITLYVADFGKPIKQIQLPVINHLALQSAPYLKRKKNSDGLPKNEQYEGYVVDLMHAVSEQIQEDYSFRKPIKTNLIKHNTCKSKLPEENIHGI